MTTIRRDFSLARRAVRALLDLNEEEMRGVVEEDGERRAVQATCRPLADGRIEVRRGDRCLRAFVRRRGRTTYVAAEGQTWELEASPARAPATGSARAVETTARSPMTGTLVALDVQEGADVQESAPLFVVEAMKMEYVVRAPLRLRIDKILARVGEQVSLDQEIVQFTPVES